MSQPNASSNLSSRLSTLSLNPTAKPYQPPSSIQSTATSTCTVPLPPKTNKHGEPFTKNQLKQHQKYRGRIPGATNQSASGQPPAPVPSNFALMANKHSQPLTAKQNQTKYQERPLTNTYQPRSESNQSKSGQLITNRHGEPLGKKACEARQKQIAEVQARRDEEATAEAECAEPAHQKAIALGQAKMQEERAKVKSEAEAKRARIPGELPTEIGAIRDFIISTQGDIARRYAAMGHPAWQTAKEDERTLAEMWKKR